MIGSVIKQEDTQWIPPVDAVLEMHSATSPAAIYPDTVWTQLKNCIIIAAGDTFKAGETGGQTQISLTADNLAAHTHSGSTSEDGAHTHTISGSVQRNWVFGPGPTANRNKRLNVATFSTSSAGAHTHTATIGSTGSGQAFDIMNPYYAVNIWQRVG